MYATRVISPSINRPSRMEYCREKVISLHYQGRVKLIMVRLSLNLLVRSLMGVCRIPSTLRILQLSTDTHTNLPEQGFGRVSLNPRPACTRGPGVEAMKGVCGGVGGGVGCGGVR